MDLCCKDTQISIIVVDEMWRIEYNDLNGWNTYCSLCNIEYLVSYKKLNTVLIGNMEWRFKRVLVIEGAKSNILKVYLPTYNLLPLLSFICCNILIWWFKKENIVLAFLYFFYSFQYCFKRIVAYKLPTILIYKQKLQS